MSVVGVNLVLLLLIMFVRAGRDTNKRDKIKKDETVWEEGMVVYPVRMEYGGKVVGPHDGDRDKVVGGGGMENAALVKAEFTLHSSGIGTDERSQYVPAGIHSLVSEYGVLGLEVGYTRGNRGSDLVTGLLPRWYVDAAPGLNVKVEIRDHNNISMVENVDGSIAVGQSAAEGRDSWGAAKDSVDGVLRVLTRLIGSSAPTIRSKGSYVVTDEDSWGKLRFEGFSTQDFPCLESVFAWIKMLPCGGQRGLSRVLKDMSLIETSYHSMNMGLKVAESGEIVLDISITALLDNHAYARDVWHRRVQSFTIDEILSSLRGGSNRDVLQGQSSTESTGIFDNCPISSSKEADGAMVLLLQGSFPRTIHGCSIKENNPEYKRCFLSSRKGQPTWGKKSGEGEDQCMEKNGVGLVDISNNIIMQTSLVATVNSHVRIKSQEKGIIVTYFQMVPWEIPMHLESLKLMLLNGTQNTNVCLDNEKGRGNKKCTTVEGISVLNVRAKAAMPRVRAGWFEIRTLITNDIVLDNINKEWEFNVLVDIEKRILSVFDYPPDMARGIDIPAPVVKLSRRQVADARQISIVDSADSVSAYGQNLLFHIPIPDASMPFNVACFTATLVSLIFGSVMNISIWSSRELEEIRSKAKTVKKKMVRFVVVLVVGGSMLLYYDPSAQASAMGYISTLKQTLGL